MPNSTTKPRERLDLTSLLDSLSEAGGEALGAGAWDELRLRVEDAYRAGRIRVALLGPFNSGKSTLANALAGAALLPMDVLPTNGAIVEVTRGPARQCRVTGAKDFEGGTEEEVPLGVFQREVIRPPIGAEVPLYRATTPEMRLGVDVVLADTPGVQSLEATHTDITYGYLGKCDAVLLLGSAQRGGFHAPDLEFVRDRLLQRTRKRLIGVLTHLDLVPEDGRQRVVEHARKVLADHAGVDTVVVGIDARMASQRRAEDGGEAADLGALLAALTALLARESAGIRGDQARKVLMAGLDRIDTALSAGLKTVELEQGDAEARMDALSKHRQQLDDDLLALRTQLGSDRDALLAKLGPELRTRLEIVADRAPAYLKASESGGGQKLSLLIQSDLARMLEELSERWIEPQLREFARNAAVAVKPIGFGEFDIVLPDHGSTFNPLWELAFEGLLLVLLNIALPGQWLMALIGRVVGGKAFESVKSQAADWIRKTLEGQIRSKIILAISGQILALESDLGSRLQSTVGSALDRAIDAVLESPKASVDAVYKQVDEALRARRAGDDAVADRRRQLKGFKASVTEARVVLERA